jgi:phospholipid-binding lipoprotein MlaA
MTATKLIANTAGFMPTIRLFCLFFLSLSLVGCATGPNANPKDPLEPFNRGVSKFNDGVDNAVLKPVATAYQKVTPSPVRTGVSNFFGNLQDVWTAVNMAFQLRGQATAETTMRVAVNTVLGLGGILDIASEAGLEKQREDFGKTLGRWGVGSGPYIVIPFFGPSTLRDTLATPVDSYGDLLPKIDHVPTRNQALALRIVDTRASLLGASRVVDDVALDKYSFIRDAYLQRRAASIYGYTPAKEEDDKEADKAEPKK